MEVQVHLEPHVPPQVYPSLHSAPGPSRGSSFSWDTRHPEALVCRHAHVCVCVLMPLEPPFKPKGDGRFPDTSVGMPSAQEVPGAWSPQCSQEYQ